MKYKRITIAGGGVLGSQLAFQIAYCGYDVTVWLINESSKAETQQKLDILKDKYIQLIKEMAAKKAWYNGISSPDKFDKKTCLAKVTQAEKNIKLETDLKVALTNCDLVIEAIPEKKDIKIDFYEKIKPLLEEKTVIVTNSSTLLPSTFAKHTGKPHQFLALHFANAIWKNNTAEVMKHANTDDKYFKEIIAFAKSINMLPLPIVKEKSGYLLNSMLVPFLLSAMDLLANGISDAKSIDLAWTKGTGAPNGPFEIIDVVGLETALNIVDQYQRVPDLFDPLLKKMMLPYNYDGMKRILEQYISEGKLGVATKEGFYKYKKNK